MRGLGNQVVLVVQDVQDVPVGDAVLAALGALPALLALHHFYTLRHLILRRAPTAAAAARAAIRFDMERIRGELDKRISILEQRGK